mgnify:CR=1 FL=1
MMRVVQGSIQFGREWNLGKNKSLKTCILFTWAQSKGLAKPYLNAQKFTYTDEQAVKYNLNEMINMMKNVNEKLDETNKNFNLFNEKYNDVQARVVPYFWLPKWGNVREPSARVLDVYKQ